MPSEIVEIRDFSALVDVGGARREISLLLMPEEVALGDYVLVHAGFAIQKVEREEALRALSYLEQILREGEDGRLEDEVSWDSRPERPPGDK